MGHYEAIARVDPAHPSVANEEIDDPTTRRCMGYARREGFGGVTLINLFALRAPGPFHLLDHPDPEGPQNAETWRRILSTAPRPSLDGGERRQPISAGQQGVGHGGSIRVVLPRSHEIRAAPSPALSRQGSPAGAAMTDQRTPTHAMIFWKRSFDGVDSRRGLRPGPSDQVAALLEAEETAPGHVLGRWSGTTTSAGRSGGAPMIRIEVMGLPFPQGSKSAFIRGGHAVVVEGRARKGEAVMPRGARQWPPRRGTG